MVELLGLGSINLPLKNAGIQPGQKFLIEVIHIDPSGKAQIRIAGQVIPALLEISVQPGEKFWAGVQKIDENGIVLARDKSINPAKDTPFDAQRIGRLYIEFGQNKDNSLSNLLGQILDEVKSVPVPSEGKSVLTIEGKSLQVEGSNNTITEQDENLSGKELIASFISKSIPQWSNLNKEGFMQLFLLFRGLGLDYERRLKNLDTMSQQDIQNVQMELKKSLKGIALSLLGEEDSNGNEKSLIVSLLERLTGQQILLQGGNPDAPFYLIEIPLQSEGELFTQRLAIKASRKGKKIDLDHCRLALHAETPTLGELGIEGWIYEAQLTLKVFSDNPDFLYSLIDESFAQTSEAFRRMGINLNPIRVAPLKTAEEFHRFLRGELREGVDYQV